MEPRSGHRVRGLRRVTRERCFLHVVPAFAGTYFGSPPRAAPVRVGQVRRDVLLAEALDGEFRDPVVLRMAAFLERWREAVPERAAHLGDAVRDRVPVGGGVELRP